jgi:hypothetical protein
MESESKTIKQNALKFSWYMRGGVSYADVMNMSVEERNLIAAIVEENLDTTKKTQLPFF